MVRLWYAVSRAVALGLFALFATTVTANAAVLSFDYSSVSDTNPNQTLTGWFTVDDVNFTVLSPVSARFSNADIIDLSFVFEDTSAPFVVTFDRTHVVESANTFVFTGGLLPTITGGGGLFIQNGGTQFALFAGGQFLLSGSFPGSGWTTKELSPVPLPAALPLFLTVLAGMGFLRWWKRRAA